MGPCGFTRSSHQRPWYGAAVKMVRCAWVGGGMVAADWARAYPNRLQPHDLGIVLQYPRHQIRHVFRHDLGFQFLGIQPQRIVVVSQAFLGALVGFVFADGVGCLVSHVEYSRQP